MTHPSGRESAKRRPSGRQVDLSEMDADEVDLRRTIMKSAGLPRKLARSFRPLSQRLEAQRRRW